MPSSANPTVQPIACAGNNAGTARSPARTKRLVPEPSAVPGPVHKIVDLAARMDKRFEMTDEGRFRGLASSGSGSPSLQAARTPRAGSRNDSWTKVPRERGGAIHIAAGTHEFATIPSSRTGRRVTDSCRTGIQAMPSAAANSGKTRLGRPTVADAKRLGPRRLRRRPGRRGRSRRTRPPRSQPAAPACRHQSWGTASRQPPRRRRRRRFRGCRTRRTAR